MTMTTKEGELLKFTNVLTSWQSRWFVVTGAELRYYVKRDHRTSGKVRGIIPLNGASILPHTDDPLAWSVQPLRGDLVKLRAPDTRHRQEWMDALRQAALSPSPQGGALAKVHRLHAQLGHRIDKNIHEKHDQPIDRDLLILKALALSMTTTLDDLCTHATGYMSPTSRRTSVADDTVMGIEMAGDCAAK